MADKKNKTWVDYKTIKEKVGIYDILNHYGLSDDMMISSTTMVYQMI
jgi:hypothetical protein